MVHQRKKKKVIIVSFEMKSGYVVFIEKRLGMCCAVHRYCDLKGDFVEIESATIRRFHGRRIFEMQSHLFYP